MARPTTVYDGETYGDLLRALRLRKDELGLTLKDLSEETGIDEPQLSRIFTGKQVAKADRLTVIAAAMWMRVKLHTIEEDG